MLKIFADIGFENGNSIHQNGDSLDGATTSDESNQGPPLNGKVAAPLLDEDTNTSFTEDSLDKPATPIVSDETNDAFVSDSTNDSSAAVDKRPLDSDLSEDAPSKRMKDK